MQLLTLLQCQRVTNVTIAVQVHINLKKKKKKKKKKNFGAEIPCQIIVKSALDAEIPLPRKNRGSNIGKRVARSSWGIGKRVARSSWDIGKRVARSSWGFPKQPTARSNDNLPRS